MQCMFSREEVAKRRRSAESYAWRFALSRLYALSLLTTLVSLLLVLVLCVSSSSSSSSSSSKYHGLCLC